MENSQEKPHQLRLSLDLRSVKDHEFAAQLSLRYSALPQLGLPALRTNSLPLPHPKIETNLPPAFASAYFQANARELTNKLAHSLSISLYHTDRLKKDQLLGVATLQLQEVLAMPLRTTSQSYARVLDAYLPVDELDESGIPTRRVASIRAILYLEDLGPSDQLQRRGFKLQQLVSQEQGIGEIDLNEGVRQVQARLQSGRGLGELQSKVVWQLQNWKRAEQTKARVVLKQKEIEFWTNISQQQRKSDLQKEKQLKKVQAGLGLLQNKLRAKMQQLIKREQKILVMEQQLQGKIGQVAKQCFHKDEQIQRIKRRAKEERTTLIKQKTAVELQTAKLRAQNAKLKVELQQGRREDDKSALSQLRNQLNARTVELRESGRQLQRCVQVKEQYRNYYEKMKSEVIGLRDKLREKQEALRQMRFEKELLLNNHRHLEQQLIERQQQKPRQAERDIEWQGGSERDQLIQRRQQLIQLGGYSPHDDLIRQFDRQIASLT